MCPVCLTTAALIAVSVTSTGGLAAIRIRKFAGKTAPGNFFIQPHRIQEKSRCQPARSRTKKCRPPKSSRKTNGSPPTKNLLTEEKRVMRERDALAAERRRMPWLRRKAVPFDGPNGKVSLLDLFEGRRQLIVYRAFFEPGVFGWPDHACRGCSLGADQVSHLTHLNARDTTLAYASRAPQPDIQRLKTRMDWKMPWYTITDSFDVDSRRRPVARPQRIHPRRRPHLPHLLHQQPRRRSHGQRLELSRHDCPRPPGELGRFAPRLSSN